MGLVKCGDQVLDYVHADLREVSSAFIIIALTDVHYLPRFLCRQTLARAACVRSHETECPLLTAFLSLLSALVTFIPEGVTVGF